MTAIVDRALRAGDLAAARLIEQARTNPAVIELPVEVRLVWLLLMDLIGRSGGSVNARLDTAAIAAALAIDPVLFAQSIEIMKGKGFIGYKPGRLIAMPALPESPRSAVNRANGRKGGARRRELAAERRAATI